MTRLFLFILAAMFLVAPHQVGAEPPRGFVTAQIPCWAEGKVIESAARHHAESPILQGVTNDGLLVELLSNEDGSSWTLIIRRPAHEDECVMTSGKGLFQIPYKAPEGPES